MNFGFTVLGFGSGSGLATAIPAGTKGTINDFSTSYYGDNDFNATGSKFISAYNKPNEGFSRVATHSGYAISWGTEQKQTTSSYYANSVAIDRTTGDKGLYVYVRGNVSYGYYTYAKAFTISGTTLSFGSETVLESIYCYDCTVAADPNNADKYMVNWRVNQAAGNHHKGCIVTLSGTTISKGTTATIHSGGFPMSPSIAWDPNTANSLVCYSDASASPDAIACTVSSTTLSVGSAVNIASGNAGKANACMFDPFNAGKIGFAYKDGSDGDAGKVVIGTVSGTSLSLGTPSEFKDDIGAGEPVIAFDPNNENKLVVVYGPTSGDNVCVKVGTKSGDSISWGDEFILDDNYAGNLRVKFDPDPAAAGQFLITYADGDNSSYITAVLCQLGS